MRFRIIFFFLLYFLAQNSFSQVNNMGKPGYINTPSAEWFKGRPLGFSFSYVPEEYSLFKNKNTPNSVNFYNVRAAFTSFMEVNLSLAYRPQLSDRIGVGDRQFDFRFRLIKEQEYLPAVVVGWTPPGTRLPILSHDYIVATKNFHTSYGKIHFSIGYGSNLVFTRNGLDDNTFWKSLKLENRNELYGNDYLYGFFGAISYAPIHYGGVMMEYDSNTVNAGAYLKPWDWLLLQGHTYEGKEWAFTAAMNFSLDFLPNSLRKHEKAQD